MLLPFWGGWRFNPASRSSEMIIAYLLCEATRSLPGPQRGLALEPEGIRAFLAAPVSWRLAATGPPPSFRIGPFAAQVVNPLPG